MMSLGDFAMPVWYASFPE